MSRRARPRVLVNSLITTADYWFLEFRDGINLANQNYMKVILCVFTTQHHSKTPLHFLLGVELSVFGDALTETILITK